MKLIEKHEYRFPTHLLPALINNDPIEDETDRVCFNDFIDRLDEWLKKYGASHYTIDYKSDSYFSHTNCLFDLDCDVTDITVYFLK